jgi:CubicO group peptidase (beta-lactamase class C family)
MFKYKKIVVAWFFLLYAVGCFAEHKLDNIDKYVQSIMDKNHIPGISVAITHDGNRIKAKGYGQENIELKVPASAASIYQIGSIGKQFTATLIMQLAEQGKLNLDDTINNFFPNSPVSWNSITLRNLLTHTSGIKDYDETDFNLRLDYSDDQLLEKIMAFPIQFSAGERWSYSNTGYLLLGMIIKKVTGKFYGDLLNEVIFNPLKMTTARVISESDIIPNRAAGYRLVNNQIKNQAYVSPTLNKGADGSLYMTVLDLVKWDRALYLRDPRLLTQSDYLQMWTPVRLNDGSTYNYGMGWVINNINGHHILEHTGHWQGFSADIVRDTDTHNTVILLANLSEVDLKPFAYHILEIVAEDFK